MCFLEHSPLFSAVDEAAQGSLRKIAASKSRCLYEQVNRTLQRSLPNTLPSLDVFASTYFPLVFTLLVKSQSKPIFVCGVVGGPGAGKTTLAYSLAELISILSPKRGIAVSLEDFYFSVKERARRGLKWRAVPGSHNLTRLRRFLDEIHRRKAPLSIPRYDMAADRPVRARRIATPPAIVFLEGWLVDYEHDGYAFIRDNTDYLLYLDASVTQLRQWRCQRECEIRRRNRGLGYDSNSVNHFWREVLGPGIKRYVVPAKRHADLILRFDNDRRLSSVKSRVP